MRKLLLPLVFGLLTLSFAINANAQQGVHSKRFTIAGPDSTINLINTSIAYHKLVWNVAGGTASVCTVALDTSANGSTWSAGGAITGQNCTSNGSSSVVNVSANYVRINMTALTVTAGASVTVTWDGYTSSPSSGSVSLTATTPVVVTPNPITGTGDISCPTCDTGSASPSQVAVFNGTNVLSGNDNLRETSGELSLGAAGLNSGALAINGSGSGSASIGVASVAGTPSVILLPKTSGTPGQVLGTDGSSPQQTSWLTIGSLASVPLPNPKPIASGFAYTGGTPATFYTVPAGRRAVWDGAYVTANTGVAQSAYFSLVVSGTPYQLGTSSPLSVTVPGGIAFNIGQSMVMEAGQSLLFTAAAGMSGNVWLNIIEFDNTSPLQQVLLTSMTVSAGGTDNVLFTVPVGKSAKILIPAQLGLFNTSETSLAKHGVYYYNMTGTTTNLVGNIKPNGGSNIIVVPTAAVTSTTVGAAVAPTFLFPTLSLGAGDQIILTLTGAGASSNQWAWGAVIVM